MSQTFFDELEIPVPDYNLGVGSGSQARQTAEIMVSLEDVLLKEKPDYVIVRGDTNSTIAAAVATAKLNIPLAHIEAGERSFNREMPEEINRLVVDCLANLHFCVSQAAVNNLTIEGKNSSINLVGDVMLDALLLALPVAKIRSNVLERHGLTSGQYALVTIHRAANTDQPERLLSIIEALNSVKEKIILPLHPRTQKALQSQNMVIKDHIKVVEPVGYFDMLTLEENARLIATDSGGVQREAYYLSVPCLTLRDETEWMGIVNTGWNKLVGAEKSEIIENWFNFSPPLAHPPIYGVGTAAKQIVDILSNSNSKSSIQRDEMNDISNTQEGEK
jgi:UDP-N-acetylglucosamine 2-epimerase